MIVLVLYSPTEDTIAGKIRFAVHIVILELGFTQRVEI